MTYSLFDDLTKLANEEPPTDSIKNLIQTIGIDACSVKRNTLTNYSLVSRARDICNAVNALIRKVNEGPPSVWEDYDKYVAAIDPLEE